VRIFAHWAIVYFGQFLENYRGNTNFWSPIFYGKSYALILTKMGRAIFWAMFSQALPVLKSKAATVTVAITYWTKPRLPDFSLRMIPKLEKCTK
jgi:hypothetical protein